MSLSITYTKDDVLLSTRPYSSWRDIQEEYEDYKASFGPWSVEEVIEFLRYEYPNMDPTPEAQVHQALIAETPRKLSFK